MRPRIGHDDAMRRWNGWGDEGHTAEVSEGGLALLAEKLGPGRPPVDATLAKVVAAVPTSRAKPGEFLDLDPEGRVRHARGQSFPDLVDLRSGRLDAVPDAVARPRTAAHIRDILVRAKAQGARLVPYGGGTSVTGGVSTRRLPDPVITVDLSGLAGVREMDERSGLVTVGAGTTGPALDSWLRERGLFIGHEPQSFDLATVGGWVAARGSGLRSFGQGRIEQLFAGGTLESPAGTMVMPPFPASAAGPDLRQLVLGSEGRLGFLSDVILRTSPVPEIEGMEAWAMPTWQEGCEAARAIAQARLPLSLVRLSTPAEARTLLAFSDHPGQVKALQAYIRARRKPHAWALLITGVAGARNLARLARNEAAEIIDAHEGIRLPGLAEGWFAARFRTPYLRNALWEAGYGSDTLETATDWSRVPTLLSRLEAAIEQALLPHREKVHVFTHLSHLYPTGASIYLSFIFRLGSTPEATLTWWRAIRAAAASVIAAEGATISHHHGVGADAVPYLRTEKGPLGIAALEAVTRVFDPDGLMNPGVLLEGPKR